MGAAIVVTRTVETLQPGSCQVAVQSIEIVVRLRKQQECGILFGVDYDFYLGFDIGVQMQCDLKFTNQP